MVSALIFLLLLLILVDLEVAQFVTLLGVGHNPQPVPEVVLLQVLLGEILQVSADRKHLLACIGSAAATGRWTDDTPVSAPPPSLSN